MTTTTTTSAAAAGPLDPIGTDLTRTLRALKLGGLSNTLPERLVLAQDSRSWPEPTSRSGTARRSVFPRAS